ITDRKQREREMAALVSVAAALRAAPTRGDMLPVIVDKAMSLIKADGGALVMHSPATAEEIFVLSRGNWSDLTGTRLPAGQGISGHVITTGRPYVAGDVRTDPYLDIAAEQLGGAYAAAGVPLLAEQQTIGALLIGRQTGFTPADVRLLTAIGDITANALYRAILIETLEHRVEERTQELTAANQQLIELGQLKDQFISMVSHEYRTPLTTILSSAEMLDLYQAKWSVEKKHEHLQQIQASVKRMTELLDQILIIGKAEAGKLAFNPAPVDLLKICRDVAEELQFSTGREDTLTFTHRGECADARLDVNLVRHILSNLLSNAVKYSPKGSSVEFEVTCKTDWAIFQITDHGIGIPPEDQARMFETFHRAKNVGNIQGTGLGLAIVKHAVDRHGGTIEVVTEVNKGTTCTVRLPIG
ncbi:MAG TPA: GAF domain-containing sensor histidine kinase, partial [Anaerolineae bacterium]|nr:GAF domain-containing sensor histidine kinase [Anaerolineae bacterium]